eukprot:Gb_19327 [translate_table: standard]
MPSHLPIMHLFRVWPIWCLWIFNQIPTFILDIKSYHISPGHDHTKEGCIHPVKSTFGVESLPLRAN